MLNSLIRNTAFSIFTHLLSRLGNTILLVFIIRQITLDSGGQYDLGLSWFFIGSRFAFWGLDHLITREIAKNHTIAPEWIVNLLFARVVLAVLVIVGIAVVLPFMPYTAETRLIIILFALSILPENINNLCLGVYAGFEEYHFSSISTFVNIVVKVIGGLLAIGLGYGLTAAVAVILAGHTVATVINLVIVKRRYLPRIPAVSLSFLRDVLPQAVPFIFIGMFYILDNRFDRILMSLLSTNEEIGIYATASTLLTALVLPAQGYRIAVLPVMARLREQTDKFTTLYYRSYKLLLTAAIPMAILTALAAAPLISTIFGRAITDSIPTLRILMAALTFVYLNTLFNRVLIVYDQQKLTAHFLTATTFLSFMVNLWLIPRLGSEGAAFGRLTSAAALFILNSIVIYRRFSIRPLVSTIARLIMITIIASTGAWWGAAYGNGVAALIFAAVYTVGLVVSGVFSAAEYTQLLRYLKQ